MGRLGFVARIAALSFLAASQPALAAETAACTARTPGEAKPLALRGTLSEADRLGLSAGVYLALSGSGGADWPRPQIEAAPSCPVATFEVEGVTWEISGGSDPAPLRWARAPGRDEYFFLTTGPGLEDARAWSAARKSVAMIKEEPVHYLVGVGGDARFVFRIYRGAPDNRQLADDLVGAMSGKLAPLAVYDPEGEAVSLFLDTASGLTSEIFRPEVLAGERSASLFGPDGRYFTPAPGNAVAMRGSGFVCAPAYGRFERSRLTVLNPNDEALDVGCSLTAGESWISVFSTRRPETRGDKAEFAQRIKAAKAEDGVQSKGRSLRGEPRRLFQAGQVWVDGDGAGQGIWFIRRGEYVVEVLATFELDATDSVFEALEALVTDSAPEARVADGPA